MDVHVVDLLLLRMMMVVVMQEVSRTDGQQPRMLAVIEQVMRLLHVENVVVDTRRGRRRMSGEFRRIQNVFNAEFQGSLMLLLLALICPNGRGRRCHVRVFGSGRGGQRRRHFASGRDDDVRAVAHRFHVLYFPERRLNDGSESPQVHRESSVHPRSSKVLLLCDTERRRRDHTPVDRTEMKDQLRVSLD